MRAPSEYTMLDVNLLEAFRNLQSIDSKKEPAPRLPGRFR